MFVTTVVVGSVSISVSYDLNQRPYIRDLVFYLGALGWTIIIVYRKKIDSLQAIGKEIGSNLTSKLHLFSEAPSPVGPDVSSLG